MKNIEYRHENSGIQKSQINANASRLKPEMKRLSDISRSKDGYGDERSFINLPSDTHQIKKIISLANKFKSMEYLVVVGIGGSNLGTMAVLEAVKGKYLNSIPRKLKTQNPKLLFADTVDPDSLNGILKTVGPAAKRRKVAVNVVSKSGKTTESIANFEVLLRLLKRYDRNYAKKVIVTTDEFSKLWNLSKDYGFNTLDIPGRVGGRYSVLSAVGLFPLAVAGIDINGLAKGADAITEECLQQAVSKNPAALSAAVVYASYANQMRIHDSFFFANDLESLGKWQRQLQAESLGKEFNLKGERVNNGFTPTVSIGSTDLHSVGQLYLAGPHDKFETFIHLKQFNTRIILPKYHEYSHLVKGLQGKSMQEIMDAIIYGVKKAFLMNRRPFAELIIKDKSAYSIGQFMQLKMIETVYLAALMDVNPFGQPKVEDYKKGTRELLERK